MKLKHQYLVAMVGFGLISFSAGWLFLFMILGIPDISTINAIGVIAGGLGLAITIKMLSTIKKIDVIVEDYDD